MGFYLLFMGYLLLDLYLIEGPLRRLINERIEQNKLSEKSLAKQKAVALLYGDIITQGQWDLRFKQDLFLLGKDLETLSPEEKKQQQFISLNRLIEEALVRLKARANDLRYTIDPARVEAEWKLFGARFKSPEDLADALKAQGLSEEVMKLRLEAKIQQEVHLETQIAPHIVPSPAELQDYYARLKKEAPPWRVRQLKHIFWPTLHQQEEQVKALAEETLARVQAGESFEQLAKKLSQDSESGSKGGDLGEIEEGYRLAPSLEKIVFELPAHEYVIKQSPLGWHLFYAGPIEEKAYPSYEEMKPILEEKLTLLRRHTALEAYLEAIKQEARAKDRLKVLATEKKQAP